MRRPARKSLKDQKRDSALACNVWSPVALDIPAGSVKRQPRKVNPDAEPKEHDEQKALVEWWHSYSRALGLDWRLLVAVPNAQMLLWSSNNPNAVVNYLLSEGMRRGMLDLILFLPRGQYHGLLIEMKRRTKGVVSDDQRTMARVIGEQGYYCQFCYGWDDARITVEKYMRGVM